MESKHAFMGAVAAALMASACTNAGTTTSPAGPTPAATARTSASAPASSPTPVAAAPSPTPVAAGITVGVGNSRFGKILVDSSGRTLYLFLADKGPTSVCYGSCAQYWPPVLTNGQPIAAGGVLPGLLSTTKRSDGTTEVTYDGHPLYYFITDKKAGDVAGQGVNGFGGLWYVVSPSGMEIR